MVDEKRLTEIFQNEKFAAEAKELVSIEDAQKLFSKYGLEMTEEEVTALMIQIGKEASQNEFTEDDLDDVSGGSLIITVGAIALGVACVGGFAVGVYNGYQSTKRK